MYIMGIMGEYEDEVIWVVLFVLVFVYFTMGAVMSYAERYGRNKFTWLFVSLVLSPFLAAFLLLLYGETKEHRKERIIEEELWKQRLPDNK